MIFKGFDFGKSLQKQVEAFKRLPLDQQKKRESKLSKAIATFAQKYLQEVMNPGAANPGQMKNAAEILVEASAAVQDTRAAYTTFTEMVARSRKVPVIPGLAGLVDKLLELPTSQTEERVNLLNWRITTGSMRPKLHLKYLSERAKLTNDTTHWLDYSWGVAQLLKKEAIKPEEDISTIALDELLENKMKLGERANDVRLMKVNAMLANRQLKEAEAELIDLNENATHMPQGFVETISNLLDRKREAAWQLHEVVLKPAINSLIEGKSNWAVLSEQLGRAGRHADKLVAFLVRHEQFSRDERIRDYALSTAIEQGGDSKADLIKNWTEVMGNLGLQPSEKARDLISKAEEEGKLGDIEVEVKTTMALPAGLTDCREPDAIKKLLDEYYKDEEFNNELASQILELVKNELPSGLVSEESRFWLIDRLLDAGEAQAAYDRISELDISDAGMADRLSSLIKEKAAKEISPELIAVMSKLHLIQGDYQSAYNALQEMDQGNPLKRKLLATIDEWVNEQQEPPPDMRMILAQVQRDILGDPAAGFETATTAALLALDDHDLQSAYQTWLDQLPEETVHTQRGQQAAFLCANKGRHELLPVALQEIEYLAEGEQENLPSEPIEWLEQLRPILDEMDEKETHNLRIQWTRLHLLFVVKGGTKEQIPAALQEATSQMAPEEAQSLVAELGDAIPASARLVFEYKSLLASGDWEGAIGLANQVEGLAVSEALPISMLGQELPAEALLPAGERMTQILAEHGDDAGQLDIVKFFGERAGDGGSGGEEADALKGFLDKVLEDLCTRSYEPAVRYRLELYREHGDVVQAAHDLTALAKQGDETALIELEHIFEDLLTATSESELIKTVAHELAANCAGDDPDRGLTLLVQAGQAIEQPDWTLKEIENIGLAAQSVAGQQAMAELALSQNDFKQAGKSLDSLIDSGEYSAATKLAESWIKIQPDADKPLMAIITLSIESDSPDYTTALANMLKLAQIYQQKDSRIGEILKPISDRLDEKLSQANDQEAQHIRLTLAALVGEHDRCAEMVTDIMDKDAAAADGLLSLFDRLALEDADLPTSMVVACGRALFKAGRVTEALDRLAGLRDQVGDYPEYITLLEEIKEGDGGPGASMQLGEAYLRVHLWQRSAEEYATALDQDPSLAEPILTQLRHHAALDPNPMKYPLHLLGLRAVAHSNRTADWGWALSALTWLRPRWSAEELYELTQDLWMHMDMVELGEAEQIELLLHIFKLAIKLSKSEAALEYLEQAWSLCDPPSPELLSALREIDVSQLGDDPKHLLKLHTFELQAAILEDHSALVISVAQQLAGLGDEGRAQALKMLAEYQESAADASSIMVARLKLLDIDSTEGRQTFLNELLSAAESDLPRDQVHSLICTVLDLSTEMTDSPVLIRLLLLLLRQLGDEARAWQLALSFIDNGGDLAPFALDTIKQLADDEFAIAQRILLVEVHLLRGEHEQAIRILEGLKLEELGDNGTAACSLAEALLTTPAGPSARSWLIEYYRFVDRHDLAADHVVWAYAVSDPKPAEWLHEQTSGDLLYRSGMLHELQGNTSIALGQYEKAYDAGTGDASIAAAIRTRLSLLLEGTGTLNRALKLAGEAAELVPEHQPAHDRVSELEDAIRRIEIKNLRDSEDSAQRTLRIAQLCRESGEISEAINELQNGISRGQNQPEVFIELAECFNVAKDFTIARRAFAEVLKRMAGDGELTELRLRALFGLAEAEENLGNIEEAIRSLEQILVVRQSYRNSRERLSELYGKMKGSKEPEKRKDEKSKTKDKILDEILSLLDMPSNDDDQG